MRNSALTVAAFYKIISYSNSENIVVLKGISLPENLFIFIRDYFHPS